jgi:hypothetical protein
LFARLVGNLPVRGLAPQGVNYGSIATLFQTSQQAPHLPLAHAQFGCRLLLCV